MVELVARIRELLEVRQLSPTQFADVIGIGRPVVSHILSGRNKPSLEVVQRIITAFPDLALPWLLNGEGAMLAAAPPATPTGAHASQPAVAPAPAAATRTRRNRAVDSDKATAAPEALLDAVGTVPAPSPTTAPEPAPPPTGSNIALGPRAPAEAASAPTTTPVPLLDTLLSADKPIRRIVIFYRDGTFADYQPEA